MKTTRISFFLKLTYFATGCLTLMFTFIDCNMTSKNSAELDFAALSDTCFLSFIYGMDSLHYQSALQKHISQNTIIEYIYQGVKTNGKPHIGYKFPMTISYLDTDKNLVSRTINISFWAQIDSIEGLYSIKLDYGIANMKQDNLEVTTKTSYEMDQFQYYIEDLFTQKYGPTNPKKDTIESPFAIDIQNDFNFYEGFEANKEHIWQSNNNIINLTTKDYLFWDKSPAVAKSYGFSIRYYDAERENKILSRIETETIKKDSLEAARKGQIIKVDKENAIKNI